METKQLSQLAGDPTNPRSINETDFKNLKVSIEKFGDISGIVFNVRTGQLVGGHQRYEAFQRADPKPFIEIVQRLDAPTIKGTVAIGFVQLNGERYSYREVDWDVATQKAANIAANRIAGEWDFEKLGEADQWLIDNAPELLEYTGQGRDEINQLLGNEPPKDKAPTDDRLRLNLKMGQFQHDTVIRAIQTLKSKVNVQDDGNDDMDANAIVRICEEYLNGQSLAG